MPPLPPVTQALILINLGMFCLQIVLGFLVDRYLALWPIGGGFLPWQIVTYAFLHGGFAHLLFNMFGLWQFGWELERLWGQKRFLQFYMASVLSAAGLQLVVSWVTGANFPVVGASGALFGLLMGYAMLFGERVMMPLIPPIPMKARTFAIIYGVAELFFGFTGWLPGIAHFAHLGGMLGGWLMIRYWRGQPPFGKRR